MSAELVERLVYLSFEGINYTDGNYVRLNMQKAWDATIQAYQPISNWVKNAEGIGSDEGVIAAAGKNIKKKVAPTLLAFLNVRVIFDFLRQLEHFMENEFLFEFDFSGDNENFSLSPTEFEEFFGSRKLDSFIYKMNRNTASIISDEHLVLIRSSIHILYVSQFHLLPGAMRTITCPKITNVFLDVLKVTPSLTTVIMTDIRTTITLEKVADIFKFIFTDNSKYVNWDFGIIQCQAEDRKYLVEMQKQRNTSAKSVGDNYVFYGKDSAVSNSETVGMPSFVDIRSVLGLYRENKTDIFPIKRMNKVPRSADETNQPKKTFMFRCIFVN